MLEPLDDLPAGVIGFRAVGELHTSDYRDVLGPAIDQVVAEGGDVRIVLVFEKFDGVSGGAAWQDLKLGLDHLTRWKRIALVTDVDWMIHLVSLFGWMTPGDMRHFPLAERAQAVTWAAG
ncbi:SpoIIAA-like protein [Krasilnikovia cinnamomea]|uniref:SpoIIAA-like protein n=1 Tax=Krasilnikovia cinnamomea TaxID=349313 RepID=A0A4Q7ZMF9_9ACTN|nr:STAS/SEC14 domain-containing protein [Krasilnikovia cinnamomea]RZU51449.1 SpoIIAA-like protein [Krasilnikovia cinnamomea]